MSGVLLLGALTLATDRAEAWSDGMAGASGAVPEHLRECVEGFEYCKVKVSGCGGCHGDWDAMRYQKKTAEGEPVNVPVVDRISAEILINGNRDTWEYEPGRSYVVDVLIYPWSKEPNRAPSTPEHVMYTRVGFNLNASGGKFDLFQEPAGEPADRQHSKNVRITGGDFSHVGSRNPNAKVCGDEACSPSKRRAYGQTVDNESQWAGELTNTGRGSNISLTPASINPGEKAAYWYRAKWTAPPREEPRGVAFVMAFMVTNGDGIDSCVHEQCNSTLGYSDQSNWDWWSYMIPRKIICEKGQNRVECTEKVQKFIIPPPPPPNTSGTDGGGPGDDGPGVTPGIGPGAWVVLFCVALARWRSIRRPPGT
jgi:hypothetical protein